MLQTIELADSEILVTTADDGMPEVLNEQTISFILQTISDPSLQESLADAIHGGKREFELSPDIHLSYLGRGSFSLVYLLEVSGYRFALKMKNSNIQKEVVNYSYEMVRMQSLKSELGDLLANDSLHIPDYYLGTIDICIREFVDGDELPETEAKEVISKVAGYLGDYIEHKTKENPYVWEGVKLDLTLKSESPGKNFMRTPEGTVFLTDPFTN